MLRQVSQLPGPPFFHPGAPHIRVPQRELPPDVAQRPAVPFSGDFETWVRTGQWESVSSSNVAAIAYNAADQLIKVRYRNGAEWEYGPFDMSMARRLYLTGSKGVFLYDYVKRRGPGTRGQHQVALARPI